MRILTLETTCDETAAAVVTDDPELEALAGEAGRAVGDPVHPLPYAPELHKLEFRSPIAYVDNIRFVAPATDALKPEVDFVVDADPVVTGAPTSFTDLTCPEAEAQAGDCLPPTSWRWDFGIQDLATPPDASGSSEQNPTVVFPESGVYAVTLHARVAGQEDEKTVNVTVLQAPMAACVSGVVSQSSNRAARSALTWSCRAGLTGRKAY